MPRRRAIPTAAATCAAATLAGPAVEATDSVSATAAGQLGSHAAADAQRALTSAGDGRRSRRLVARAGRHLRFAYRMTAQLQNAHDAKAVDAAIAFTAAAKLTAERFALIASGSGRGLRGAAAQALGRAARMQTAVAETVAAFEGPGSLVGHRAALRTALRDQDELVSTLTRIVATDDAGGRRPRSLRRARADAEQTRDALAAALFRLRSALDPDVEAAAEPRP